MSDLFKALAASQSELSGKLKFDSTNPHFKNKYISLGGVLDIVLPVFQANGLLLMQQLTTVPPGLPGLRQIIAHVESGEAIDDSVPFSLEKDNPQGVGSAITYYRRYAILSALGLVADEDDDGEAASKSGSTSAQGNVKPRF